MCGFNQSYQTLLQILKDRVHLSTLTSAQHTLAPGRCITRLRRAPRSDWILMLEIWRKIKFLELFIETFLANELPTKIFMVSAEIWRERSFRASLWPKVLIFHEDRYFGPFRSDY